jgi:hypothetical protein
VKNVSIENRIRSLRALGHLRSGKIASRRLMRLLDKHKTSRRAWEAWVRVRSEEMWHYVRFWSEALK